LAYYFSLHSCWNQCSSVGIVTRLQPGQSGVRFLVGSRGYYFFRQVQSYSVAHPVYCSSLTTVLSPGVRRPKREENSSPLFTAEVNYEWSCTYAYPVCLHGLGKETTTLVLVDKQLDARFFFMVPLTFI